MLKKRRGRVCIAFRWLRMRIGVNNLEGIGIFIKGGYYLEQLCRMFFSRWTLLHGINHFTAGVN
jgi:hypothetical protein